jgi:hypothetical protein
MPPYTARQNEAIEYKSSILLADECRSLSPSFAAKRLFSWNGCPAKDRFDSGGGMAMNAVPGSSDVTHLAYDDFRHYSEFLGAAGCGDSAIGRNKVPLTRGLQENISPIPSKPITQAIASVRPQRARPVISHGVHTHMQQ